MPSRPFDPQRDGFTFPNSWTLTEKTSDEIRERIDSGVDAIFAWLPRPISLSRRAEIHRTVDEWVHAASTQVYGLCGGMAFAALDYYLADCPRPTEETSTDQIPPELRSYILLRMRDSFLFREDRFQPNNVSRVLIWMAVEHLLPKDVSQRYLLQWTRNECIKLNWLIAEHGAWPIALIGQEKDPCKNHQVLAYECPCQRDDKQTIVSIYDVNYPGSGYHIKLDFRGSAFKAAAEHPYDPRKYAWEPLRGLFCEAYTRTPPNV